MGSTTNYAIPYPELTDPPDGAGQMKALATKVDTQMKTNYDGLRAMIPNVRTATASVVLNNATVGSTTVTFTPAFAAGAAAQVFTNVYTGAGGSTQSSSRALSLTQTGCSVEIWNPVARTMTLSAMVMAMEIPTSFPRSVEMDALPDGWHTVTATCRNADCVANGIAIPGLAIPDDRATWQGISCGACSRPITDSR